MKRNLYYYLYPVSGSLWDWHLDQLRRHAGAFNGKKVVVVAADRRTAPLAAVKRRLAGFGARLLRVRNDPARGEAASFAKGLGLLRSLDASEMTFYAHGKGVTHTGLKSLVMQSWSEAMYAMNLSAPGAVERLMRDHSAVGCFRQEVPHGGSSWHFSGTFFWFKHAALFARSWRDVERSRYGVEGWLGRHLPVEESFSLTPYRHFADLYRRGANRRETRGWLKALRRLAPR